MLIETWVAALFMVLLFLIGIGALLGWMMADQRYEEAMKENKALHKENTNLKSKLDFTRLYIELEERK
jgi:uncharacterized protein YneF (UPF0154 family)